MHLTPKISEAFQAERPRRTICFIAQRIAGRSGGAERVLIETANALAARGHRVEILSHEANAKPPFYPLNFGVTHTNLRLPDAMRGAWRQWIDTWREETCRGVKSYAFPRDHLVWLSQHGAFWRRLERHLNIHRPDVAIAIMPPAVVALGLVRPRYPLRRIASLHNVPEHDLCNPSRWDPNPLDRKRRMEALPRHDCITVLLPEFCDWFPAGLREKVAVVPNVVRPVPAERIAAARREKTVISVGRLAPVKRHGLLIEAWARLADEFPDWTLKIFGVGPLKKELVAQVNALGLSRKIRLMGHTDAIAEQYLSASLLAHPAEYEGWGLAVTEALAAGVPAVAFADCPGVNQLVRSGTNGLLISAGGDRLDGLSKALAGLMRDPQRRSDLAQAAPDTVRGFAPKEVTDLWEQILYEDALLRTNRTGSFLK